MGYTEKREKQREQEEIEKAPKRTLENVPQLLRYKMPFDDFKDVTAWDDDMSESFLGDKDKFNRFVSNN
jgi:hypothetical protein